MDRFDVRRGTALPLAIAINDAAGLPVGYTGAEALAATVWAGSDRAAAFALLPRWVDPAKGSIALTVSALQTLGLAEGRWYGTVELDDPAAGLVEAYAWAMDVLPSAGMAASPPAYCTFADLLRFGRAWVRDLQTPEDDAGFGWACGRARSWLDDLILARYPSSGGMPRLGEAGYGALACGLGPPRPSAWLRGVLDAGGLLVRPWAVEATAKRALSYIAEGQVGVGESGDQYRLLAARLRTESYNLALSSSAEIVANPAQKPAPAGASFAINLGAGSLRR